MSKLGMATMIHPDNLSVHRLMQAITGILDSPRPEHNIDLDGAQETRILLESLCL